MILDSNFQLSQAFEAHEHAVSWETFPRAWRANVHYVEMYNGLKPVPESFCKPVDGLSGDKLNELLGLCAAKKMSLMTSFVTPPIESRVMMR